MIKIKKNKEAYRSHGRGMDNWNMPGQYGIYDGDKLVGYIKGQKSYYMQLVKWEVCRVGDNGHIETVRLFWNVPKAFTAAKKWAMNNF